MIQNHKEVARIDFASLKWIGLKLVAPLKKDAQT